MTDSHPDFRDPPQEMIRRCVCGLEIPGAWYGHEDDEIECQNGHTGEWQWVLRYPVVDRNAG